jgi:PAS domain-containing protein
MAQIRDTGFLRCPRRAAASRFHRATPFLQRYLLKNEPEARALPKAIASWGDRTTNAEALPNEEERAQCTLDSIGDALISTNLTGRVTYLNFAAEQLTGWLREDAIGQRIVDIFQIIDAASALVGNDGVVGVPLFMGDESTSSRALVQSAGRCLRLTADLIIEEFHQYGPTLRLLLRYTQALITQIVQSAACHRHHSLDQQLCRWLLLSYDRLRTNQFATTRHVMANILGTRRGHITEQILQLHRDGVIHCACGHITLLKRASLEERSCECYLVIKNESSRLLPDKRAT